MAKIISFFIFFLLNTYNAIGQLLECSFFHTTKWIEIENLDSVNGKYFSFKLDTIDGTKCEDITFSFIIINKSGKDLKFLANYGSGWVVSRTVDDVFKNNTLAISNHYFSVKGRKGINYPTSTFIMMIDDDLKKREYVFYAGFRFWVK